MSAAPDRGRDLGILAGAILAIAGIVVVYVRWLHVSHPLIVGFTFLLVVLLVAANTRFWVAAIVSIVAMLAFNFFFLPPVGTLYLADPQNWVALFVFLAVGLVASSLSSVARARTAEATARRDAENARKSEAMKSALLASLGHDLRTPLTAIRVAASNLKASWLSESERREQSDVVLTEVARLTRLFQNILDMARIDAGAVQSNVQWVDPLEIIDAAKEQVEHALREHPVRIAAATEGLVRLDPRLTAAALGHLLENAAQYSGGGSAIDVTASRTDGELLIQVRDHGPGIAPADMPQLFHRFYRGGQGGRHASGSGMGLSIARGLLAVEGARVWADNAPGDGTVFSIAVPVEWKVPS